VISALFTDKSSVTQHDDNILIKGSNGFIQTYKYSEFIDFPKVTRSFFFVKIDFSLSSGICRSRFSRFSAVYKVGSESLIDYASIGKYFDHLIGDKKAQFALLAEQEYLRDSSVDGLEESIAPVITNFKSYESSWLRYISNESAKWLSDNQILFPVKDNVEVIRKVFEKNKLAERKHFYDRIESNPLTQEQRLAVIRENDRNLVLAAAGTGKTSVMVAKALDLIDSGVLGSSDILILAYNNAAAKELKERVSIRADEAGLSNIEEPHISTFHSLGRKILRESKITTHLSKLSEDSKKFDKWVHDWLIDYILSSPEAMKNFIAIHYHPADPFEFKTNAEYERFIRDNEYRSLSGDLVRGYQELLIANWLYLNGIPFEYEAQYVTKVRVDIGYDYKPDFYIKDTDIYIEHFGVDRLGNTRADIDSVAYNKGIDSKRELHLEHETQLIETFHYDWCEGCLEASLERQLKELGVEPSPISKEKIFESFNESGVIDNGAKILQKSLQAIRVEQLSDNDVMVRLEKGEIPFADKHSVILNSLHESYVSELQKSNTIDFDDMIIRASECIADGRFKPKWKFILVDEFQDISGSRMQFVQNMIDCGPNPKLTVVGDDWQSIYRFSGGKLELTTRFTELVGKNTLTKLQKTFRYNNSIADTAGTFIMENDEQYKKHIVTHTAVDKSQIYLLDSKVSGSVDSMALKAVQIIRKVRENDESGSIAVLSRYNYLLKDAREEVASARLKPNVKFWTFHGSKGLEADYCILLGFSQGKIGFPNENKDDEIVESLLPTLDDFPHSEERRLMYVALTRAKKKAYIIANPTAPSAFINELITPKYDVNIVSASFQGMYRSIFKCPACTDGYFKKIDGKFGEFYSCSSRQACMIKPRVCKSCGSPSIDNAHNSVCRNKNCGDVQKICPRCARPMKKRQGKFGEFYGCTGYGIKDDQCKNTVRI